MTISERFVAYAEEVHNLLKSQQIRVELDNRDDKIGAKIRDARLQQVPYMFIIGEREVENRTVSVRVREEGDIGAMDLNVAVERIRAEADIDF